MNRLVVDTGVFSASLSLRRRPQFERYVSLLTGERLFLASQTAADLWIAATARHIEAALVTADRLFAETPGLDLEPV